MPLHLYAVVLAEQTVPDHPGLRDEELEVVRSGELAAVVSPVDPDVEATDADAIAHLDVITTLLAQGPVVPMRFGTVAPDADAVRDEVLDGSRDEFTEQLRATADVIEVLLTIDFDEDTALREIVSHDARLGDSSRGAASLPDRIAAGEEIADHLNAAVRDWGEQLVGPAAELVEALTPLNVPTPTSVRYALLVRRDRLADLDAQLHKLPPAVADNTVPFAVEYVGPLPPLDFPRPSTADGDEKSRWGW